MLKFPKRQQTRINIHLTALIDMVFLLLIYFLLTSSFAEQEAVAVSVPEVGRAGLAERALPMVVIDADGRFYLDNEPLSDRQLEQDLRLKLTSSGDSRVVIRADKGVVYQRVARALDIARQGGARELNLAVETRR